MALDRRKTLTLLHENRNNIAAAKLAGLEADLHLSSVEYSTAVSILFVGYVVIGSSQLGSSGKANKHCRCQILADANPIQPAAQ